MTGETRKQVMTAVFNIMSAMTFSSPINGASAWVTKSKRLKLWEDVDLTARPYSALVTHTETDDYTGLGLSRRRLDLRFWCYATSSDTEIGQDILDIMMESFDNSFGQNAVDDFSRNENTLGGLVYWCRIQGKVLKVPGDIDNDTLLIVPLVIEMP